MRHIHSVVMEHRLDITSSWVSRPRRRSHRTGPILLHHFNKQLVLSVTLLLRHLHYSILRFGVPMPAVARVPRWPFSYRHSMERPGLAFFRLPIQNAAAGPLTVIAVSIMVRAAWRSRGR